ncbi:amidohydrolase family protein [Microbulbifer hainanensis]|uniref:amidohydrolase family protein n=1 Tax=Microbulbifer hainanensis TaxID=2735675 RepID=UPI00186723D9|nr:amidohydrolase family protein [Microbulbifer hainanensis]
MTWEGIRRGGLLYTLIAAAVLALAACGRAGHDGSAEDVSSGAKLVLKNAYIVTLDPQRPQAAAMALDNGRILYIGAEEGVDKFVGAHTRVEDLQGRLVLPGFVGAQLHAWALGNRVDLRDAASVGDCQQRVAEFMRTHPQRQVIVGQGWNAGIFTAGGPHKDQLDQVSDFYPIVLFSGDRASVWTNSEALAAAGINHDTPNPPGGVIEKDENGLAIGLLREESAMALVEKIIPENTADDYRAELRALLAEAGRRAGKAGSLAVGQWADFTVLDKNLLQLPLVESTTATVWRRYQRGELVAGSH